MDLQSQLVAAATAYGVLRGVAPSTLARTVIRDGAFFSRLDQGGSCTLRTYERFFAYFADQGLPDPVAALAEQQRREAATDPRQSNLPLPSRRENCGRPGEPGQENQAPVPTDAKAPEGARASTGNGRAAPHHLPEEAA